GADDDRLGRGLLAPTGDLVGRAGGGRRRGARRRTTLEAAADVAVAGLALLQDGEERRRDEDRGVRTGRQPDEQRERELLERLRTEEDRTDHEQRRDRDERGDRRVQRAHQR